MGIRILLVDDHEIVRKVLRSLIDAQLDMEVVAEIEEGQSAVQQVGRCAPDMAIVDIGMPHLDGIEATRQIVAAFPDVKVIASSMFDERRMVAAAFEAGASGYLLKNCASEELIQAILAVADGQTYLNPGIS